MCLYYDCLGRFLSPLELCPFQPSRVKQVLFAGAAEPFFLSFTFLKHFYEGGTVHLLNTKLPPPTHGLVGLGRLKPGWTRLR